NKSTASTSKESSSFFIFLKFRLAASATSTTIPSLPLVNSSCHFDGSLTTTSSVTIASSYSCFKKSSAGRYSGDSKCGYSVPSSSTPHSFGTPNQVCIVSQGPSYSETTNPTVSSSPL